MTVSYDDYKFGSEQAQEEAQRKFYKEEKERLDAIKALEDAKARGADESEIQQLQESLDKETKEAVVANVEYKQEQIKNLFTKNLKAGGGGLAAMKKKSEPIVEEDPKIKEPKIENE